MVTRNELVSVAAQIANGILSSDGSVMSKVFDRTLHKNLADTCVSLAYDIITKAEERVGYPKKDNDTN